MTLVPLYQTVRQYVQGLIDSCSLLPEQKLPSERELVEHFQSTRVTVREALVRLESDGLIYRSNRRGWFIAPKRFVIDPTQKVNFNQMALAQGRAPATELIEAGFVELAASIREELMAQAGRGFYLCRVRSLDGRNVMAEETYLNPDRFPGIEGRDLTQSVTQLLQKEYAVEIAREYSSIQVASLDEEFAANLATNNGAPCLKILRKRYNAQDALIDYNIEYWIHNAVEMQVWGC